MATVTRLCVTKSVPTVNGQFPGPKLVVREGDTLVIRVTNNINNNVTFHWYVRSYARRHVTTIVSLID
jgi:laccase